MDFEAFFAASHRRTVGSLFVVLGSFAEAEDVVQEAYHRASLHWERVSTFDDPEAWVRRVALNLALSSLRRARRRAVLLLRYSPEPPIQTAPDEAIDLHRALRRLPVKYRTVLALRYLMDLSVQQIADELDLPVETVRSQLARGRTRLAALLHESGAAFELEARHDF